MQAERGSCESDGNRWALPFPRTGCVLKRGAETSSTLAPGATKVLTTCIDRASYWQVLRGIEMNAYGRGLGGIVMALWMVGCGDDGAAASSSSGSGGGSGDEGEAQKQAAAEIERHWSRDGDGWKTYRT